MYNLAMVFQLVSVISMPWDSIHAQMMSCFILPMCPKVCRSFDKLMMKRERMHL